MIDQRVSWVGLAGLYRGVLMLWAIKVLIDPFPSLASLPIKVWQPIGPLAWMPLSWRSWLWTEVGPAVPSKVPRLRPVRS